MVIEGMAFPAQKQFPWKKFFLFFRLTHEAFHAVAVAVDVAVVLLTRWHKFGSKLNFFFSEWHTKKENDVFDDSSLSIIKDCFCDCWIKMADAFKMI